MVVLLVSLSAVCYASERVEKSSDFLVDLGHKFLEQGRLSLAEREFNKALIVEPFKKEAKEGLAILRGEKVKRTLDAFSQKPKKDKEETSQKYRKAINVESQMKKFLDVAEDSQEKQLVDLPNEPTKNEILYALNKKKEDKAKVGTRFIASEKYSEREIYNPIFEEKKEVEEGSGLKLEGDYQLSFGVEDGDLLWKKADYDLNEENWRVLSEAGLNRGEDTFDPAVFSQLRLRLNYPNDDGWGFHSYFDISPWSFIGKSEKTTISSGFGDTADVQLKCWANTRYTIDETVYTNISGNSFLLPEIKVIEGKTPTFRRRGKISPSDIFSIPELKIHREFWPLRELSFDYNKDNNINLKVFLAGLEDAAYTSDDPLMLSNKANYWEESQWLVKWSPGHFNSDVAVRDFFKGRWDDSLAFRTRDSLGTRLTSLRGVSLNLDLNKTTFDFNIASPKELWQDYDSFSTWGSALRGKHFCSDNLTLGTIYTSKFGYNKRSMDAYNHTVGLDMNYGLTPNTQILMEIVNSRSEYDMTSSYETEKRGNAFHVDLINSSAPVFGKDYFGVNSKKDEPFYKLKLSLTHMDDGFESALSSYRETRDDAFWGRHLTFRKPFDYYFAGLGESSLGWDDVEVFKIGDGIDYGRDTVNFRIEAENLFDDKLDTLFDVRNVHDNEGKYIENVSRLEATGRITPKLTSKFLGLYHDLPDTVAGVDPFVNDPRTDTKYTNEAIEEGKDPSLKTASLGLKYDLFDWLDVNGIWEHTNDATLAYDNFPRNVFNGNSLSRTFWEEGMAFRDENFWLNNPYFFPQPPYSWYDIFKVGVNIKPTDKLRFYLDWTRNEYEWAQLIDDNTNHIGIEAEYLPTDKLGFNVRYVYSKAKDMFTLNDSAGTTVTEDSHHNIFAEGRMKLDEDSELVAQYGVGTTAAIGTSTTTPFGGGQPTLDTQHIFRVYYRKRF
jgi:hypothetical protein